MKTYKYLWKLIKYRPYLFLSNCILWSIIHMLPLIPGIIAKEFFDSLSGKASVTTGVGGILSLFIVYGVVQITFILIGAPIDIIHRFNMSSLIRNNMLQSILNQPGAKAIKCSSGEAISCFREDVLQVEDAISWINDLVGSLLFSIGAICILLSINAKITLFVFAPLVIVVILAQTASNRIESYRRASREATSEVTGAIGEMFSSVQSVQSAGTEEYMINNFKELNNKRHKLMLKDSVLTQTMDAIFENTVSLGTGLILLLAAKYMRAGSFTVGDFALFQYYLTFVTDFTLFFGDFLATYKQTGVAFERISSVHEICSPKKP